MKKFILLWIFISTGWYFTILLPPILFNLAKKVWDSLLQGPVGVSWISDSSKTLSSSNWGEKVKITLKRLFSRRLCLHKHFNESIIWNKIWGGFYASPSAAMARYFIQVSNRPHVEQSNLLQSRLSFSMLATGSIFKRGISVFQQSLRAETFPMHLKPKNTYMSGICNTAWMFLLLVNFQANLAKEN